MGCSNSTMQGAKTPRGEPMLRREKTGFVAFHIDLKNSEFEDLNKNIDAILSKPLPKRLQRLEPLNGASKLTTQDLDKKLELAELKRQKTFEKRLEFTRKDSVRRSTIMEQNDSTFDPNLIKEKLENAEKLRLQKLSHIQEKQRIKSERAERIRQNARKMRDEGLVELESQYNQIEHDESSGNDSWSDTEKKQSKLSKSEFSHDSSGYSSRNISANKDEPWKNTINKSDFKSEYSFESENVDNQNGHSKKHISVLQDNLSD